MIIATNDTIKNIVKSEIEKLGANADLNHIDVSNVTDMSYMFANSSFTGKVGKYYFENGKQLSDSELLLKKLEILEY